MLALVYAGVRSCIVEGWTSPTETTTYSIHGADGRSLSLIFLPHGETLIVYTIASGGAPQFLEAVRTKMRGRYATHLVGRIWNVNQDGGFFGYRIYPPGAAPVLMDCSVLKKCTVGTGTPTLRAEGDRTHPTLLFTESAVRFEDMWLEKETTSDELVESLLRQLKPSD